MNRNLLSLLGIVLVFFVAVSCQKEIPTEDWNNPGTGPGSGTGGTTINADYYYKATIEGVNYVQTATPTNGYIAGSGLGGTDIVSFSADISPEDVPPPPNATGMSITKGLMRNYLSASDAAFRAFFALGDHPYTRPGLTSFENGDGVYIMWGDKEGKDWSTEFGSGDQTGSTFKIVSVVDERDALGTLYIRVKMQFSCKFYKEGTGEMKRVTNGEFVGLFGKI